MLAIRSKTELLAKLVAIPLAALLGSHYIFGQRFPWEPGYQFPLIPFCMIASIMTTVWYANSKVFQRLDRILPFHRDPLRRLVRQFLEGASITLLIYSVIYLSVTWLILGFTPTLTGFTTGMLVCIVISSLVNGIYVLAYLIHTVSFEKDQSAEAIQAALSSIKTSVETLNKIVLETGNKTTVLEDTEIAYAYSSGGNVWVIKTDGQKLLTNYDSFAKLETQLSGAAFFRLSRQYLVHHQAIRTVKEEVNRKLCIQLIPVFQPNANQEQVIVSRYRAAEFRKWFAGLQQH